MVSISDLVGVRVLTVALEAAFILVIADSGNRWISFLCRHRLPALLCLDPKIIRRALSAGEPSVVNAVDC